eukprot:1364960-Amorphochlora_amoeboformis.AAC.1
MQTSTADNSRQSGSICPTSKSHLHALKYISMPRRRRKKRNSCVGMCGIPLPHWLSPEKLFRFLVSGRGIDTLSRISICRLPVPGLNLSGSNGILVEITKISPPVQEASHGDYLGGYISIAPRQTIEYSEDKSLQPALPVMISSLRLPLRRLRSTRYCRSIIQPVRPAARAFHAAPRAQPYMVRSRTERKGWRQGHLWEQPPRIPRLRLLFRPAKVANLALRYRGHSNVPATLRLGKAIFARAEPTPMEKHFGYALVQASDVYHFRLEE